MTAYEPVIGLEIHVQLSTASKIFARESTSFGDEPNRNTSPVCLGLPGALPVLNAEAVRKAVQVGLALNCQINPHNSFSRKNYYYPDLPKGYQISQFDEPICGLGWIEVDVEGTRKRIGITRAHLEEDAGKNIHDLGSGSLVDFNRAGVPLLEIVSEPDLRTAEEARAYFKAMRELVVYLGVCDGNLEEGNMRCDVNISVRPVGQERFGTKVEIKNVNSYRFVKMAIEYEIERQVQILERGGSLQQETRLFDPGQGLTRTLRTKEDAHDYRYFPDPDLPPLSLTAAYVEEVRAALPELPRAKADRFVAQYGLPAYDAALIAGEKALADYFERAVTAYPDGGKGISNWLMSELLRVVKEQEVPVSEDLLPAAHLAEMVRLIENKTISGKIGKTVFEEMLASRKDPETIIREKGLVQISDPAALRETVAQVFEANPTQVGQALENPDKLLGFFVGLVMRATKGKADPALTNTLIREEIERRRG